MKLFKFKLLMILGSILVYFLAVIASIFAIPGIFFYWIFSDMEFVNFVGYEALNFIFLSIAFKNFNPYLEYIDKVLVTKFGFVSPKNNLASHLENLGFETLPADYTAVRKRVKELAKQYHPDLASNEAEAQVKTLKMQEVNESAEYLKVLIEKAKK